MFLGLVSKLFGKKKDEKGKSAYNMHILDDQIHKWSMDLAENEAPAFKEMADQVYINKPLGDLGQKELASYSEGRIGDTLLARTANQRALRSNRTLKASSRLGSQAMARGAVGSNSDTIFSRLYAKQMQENEDKAADQVMEGLPNWISQAGNWAEAPNRGLAQKAQLRSQYSDTLMNAARLRQSNTQFEKKQSFWGKLANVAKVGAGIAGAFFNPAAGITSGLSGLIGGGGGAIGGIGAASTGASGAVDAAKRLF
jgi:hypothetical protein